MDKSTFRHLYSKGLICELAVMDAINNNLTKKLFAACPYDYFDCTDDVGMYAPYDLMMFCAHKNKKKLPTTNNELRTIEVKSATNGGKYTTFFAEILQTKSQGYAEYLVKAPTYVVYVDVLTRIHYWYDGDMFTTAVAFAYPKSFQPPGLHAIGITFDMEDPEFGFIGTVYQKDTWPEVIKKHDKRLQEKFKENKRCRVHKTAPFLPTLE